MVLSICDIANLSYCRNIRCWVLQSLAIIGNGCKDIWRTDDNRLNDTMIIIKFQPGWVLELLIISSVIARGLE